jgi:hypothetical protein
MWEYQIYRLSAERDLESVKIGLNGFGNDSWELVVAYPAPDANMFIFKKRKD